MPISLSPAAFIGRVGGSVAGSLINDIDTASGVRSDATINTAAVPSGKCIYLKLDAAPNALMTQFAVDLSYYY